MSMARLIFKPGLSNFKIFSSSKIEGVTAILSSKYKWAWHAQFLSQVSQTLKLFITFEGVLMLLYELFAISHSFRDSENHYQCSVHTWSLSLDTRCIFGKKAKRYCHIFFLSPWTIQLSNNPNIKIYDCLMGVSMWACSFLLNDNVEYTLTNSLMLDSLGT